MDHETEKCHLPLSVVFSGKSRLSAQLSLFSPEAIEKVSEADPSNIQEVAAGQLKIMGRYQENVLQQVQQSFITALVASSFGLLLFIGAMVCLFLQKPENISTIGLIGGALVEVIAGINFYLYGEASKQFASFHKYLDRTQNFLLANSVCTNLQEGEVKENSRAELVRLIANAPLTISSEKQNKTSDKKE